MALLGATGPLRCHRGGVLGAALQLLERSPALRSGAHAIVKHDEGIAIARTYPFSHNDFPGAERALKARQASQTAKLQGLTVPRGKDMIITSMLMII